MTTRMIDGCELRVGTDSDFRAVVCLGRVTVYVPLFVNGQQDTVIFDRIGNTLYGNVNCHWRSKAFVKEARRVAKKALSNLTR